MSKQYVVVGEKAGGRLGELEERVREMEGEEEGRRRRRTFGEVQRGRCT